MKHPRLSVISAAISAASLLLASSAVFAAAHNYKGENYKGEAMPAPCPAPVTLKDGFYLGGQVGYDSYRIRENINDVGFSFNPATSATGWVGGLFIGYGKYLTDLFYLGGELYGNYSGAQSSATANDDGDYITGKVNVHGSWGLALVPGIKLNDTSLGYLKLGWNWVNIKGKGTVNVDGDVDSFSKTKTANGFDLGVGIETLVYEDWSVRTEYNHTWYNSFNAGGIKFNPSDNQFMVGVVYHFA